MTKSIMTGLKDLGAEFPNGTVDSTLNQRKRIAELAPEEVEAIKEFNDELGSRTAPDARDGDQQTAKFETLPVPMSSKLAIQGTSPGGGRLMLTVYDFRSEVPESLTWADDRPVLSSGGAELVHPGGPDAWSAWESWNRAPGTGNPMHALEVHGRSGLVGLRMELASGRESNTLTPRDLQELATSAWAEHG